MAMTRVGSVEWLWVGAEWVVVWQQSAAINDKLRGNKATKNTKKGHKAKGQGNTGYNALDCHPEKRRPSHEEWVVGGKIGFSGAVAGTGLLVWGYFATDLPLTKRTISNNVQNVSARCGCDSPRTL